MAFPEHNIFTYETLAQLANAPDIDIVYVVTPNALHARYAIAAARAGKHVISEKPFTTTVADAEAVITACRDAKVKLSIGYRLHFDPYYREYDAARARKGIWRLHVGQRRIRQSREGDGRLAPGQKPWVAEPLRDVGIYVIQAACMAAAEAAPVSITAQKGPTTRGRILTEESRKKSMSWTVNFANGFVCNGLASYAI